MAPLQPPVIVLPGITATTLRDEYPMGPEGVWGMLRKAWERVQLHPDDTRYELQEPARVMADAVFGFPYGNFIEDLRHDLSPSADRPVPVFPFPYDWRQPLAVIERELEAFVKEVAARTSLLRHYHAAGYRKNTGKVDLVGHSMGGLVIAGYVDATGGKRVRRVATLGTPFKGSFEAALKMITGLGTLGDSASREREVARLTPAIYHLLPRFGQSVTADPGLTKDLFRANTWQPSVAETIAEYIRLHGREAPEDPDALLAAAAELFQRLLSEASDHRTRTNKLSLAQCGMTRNDWLAVVGVGEKTRVHLHIENHDGVPWFDLGSVGRKQGYPDGATDENGFITARPVDTGDGTVPYEAAVPSFLAPENVVCVSDDDFGYWEIRDRFVEGVATGLHAMLPAMNVVEKLVVCHLKGEEGQPAPVHGGVWGRRPPGVSQDGWSPPFDNLRDRT